MRRFIGVAAIAVAAFFVFALAAAAAPSGVTSNGFETDTAGWVNNDGTITREQGAPSSYVNPGGYAVGIPAAAGSYYAALDRGPCSTEVGGGGDTVYCSGPYTDWGNLSNATWNGPYQTQVDIYLDTAYANAHPDTYGGNLTGLSSTSPYTGDGTDYSEFGTRFDFTSAINDNTGGFLRDFGFNVSTGYADKTCDGFVISAGTNVNRTGANPNVDPNSECIATSGWYTFKNSFSSQNGYLDVLMTITPVGSSTPVASWDITKGSPNYANGDADGTYGCNRYGWFSDQEIYGLPIDNASITGGCAPSAAATLTVTKFYDANANGIKDAGESDITGWKVQVANGSTQTGTTPFTASNLAPGDYTASEFSPIQPNWIATTPTSVLKTLVAGDDKTVSFGNVCTGAGGGLTIGFWTNKNGQALVGSSDITLLQGLNLRNADGTPFDPTAKGQLKTWLSKATATNMAYMLSAQLAAMELNVANGKVLGSALVYAPGTQSANTAGFATVSDLMAEANTELGLHGLTPSGNQYRSYQETLKNALDQANNNMGFAQSAPCTFSFPPGPCEAGTGDTGAAYNAIPNDVAHCGPPAEGFEANSDNEFGDEVTLDTTGGTNLASMTVDFQSYGCSVSGHWNTGDCVSSTADTFTIPDGITATIYSVGAGDTVGPVIATSTVNPNIPFRPSADNTNCTGADAGKWFDSVAGACRNSYSYLVTFGNWTFPNGAHTFSSGETVIWTVQFATSHAGYDPIVSTLGTQTCNSAPGGCGYDSLNVGAKSYVNAPYAGTDVNEDIAYRSHGNANYGAPFVPLGSESGWTGFRPLGEIVLN